MNVISISTSTEQELENRIEALKKRIETDATSVNKKLNSTCEVVPPPKRSKSVIDTCGVRVQQKEKLQRKLITKSYYICIAGSCGENGTGRSKTIMALNPSSTSNCTTHLRGVHNLVSSKTSSREETVKRIEKKLELSRPGFQDDPRRWFEVHARFLLI